MRLKLLNELQDVRGTVRVYCRPRTGSTAGSRPALTTPTHDTLVLDGSDAGVPSASFKYDRVFAPGASRREVFAELEEPLISALDGFNVTLLAFGQGGSGKTHTLLGDGDPGAAAELPAEDRAELPSPNSYGVQTQAIQQLFNIASHRTERYRDQFSMTVVEVHEEKLTDLVAGTPSADCGEAVVCETRDRRGRESAGADPGGRLEIRTDIDGHTVVQGLICVPVASFEEAVELWREAAALRAGRLRAQGLDAAQHERRTSVIATVHVTSVSVATGVGTEGRLQFVDMAASDTVKGARRARDGARDDGVTAAEEMDDTRFSNKSIEAFNDVVNARCQFDRSVPYRNSTLTHLLRDSLEADTKVLLLCCVSSEQAHLVHTLGALRFASRMQKVAIGKATKHIVGSKE